MTTLREQVEEVVDEKIAAALDRAADRLVANYARSGGMLTSQLPDLIQRSLRETRQEKKARSVFWRVAELIDVERRKHSYSRFALMSWSEGLSTVSDALRQAAGELDRKSGAD